MVGHHAPRARAAEADRAHHPQAALRHLFLLGTLLGYIARVAARTVIAAGRTLTGERHIAAGSVASLQTHGSRANWRPHLPLLVTDGGCRPDGTFVSWPVQDIARLTGAFRRAVLRVLVRLGVPDEDQAEGMLT